MKKPLLVTNRFPPYIRGESIIHGNLFSKLKQDDYCVLTYGYDPYAGRWDPEDKLDCKYYNCIIPKFLRITLFRRYHDTRIEYILLPWIILLGLWAVWREHVEIIFATMNVRGSFLIAAYYIHCITGKPLHVYLVEVWEETFDRFENRMAHRFEERILKSAKKLYVMSEALGEHCKRKHSIDSTLLASSIDLSTLPNPKLLDLNYSEDLIADPDHEVKIVFVGSIWGNNRHCLSDLALVINGLSERPVKFIVVSSSQTKDDLAAFGIFGERIDIRGFLTREEIKILLQDADILFMPLSFDTAVTHPEALFTIFSTKFVNYMAAGCPILVYAPPEYQITRYAKEKDCALVVDRRDPNLLREAIVILLSNVSLRRKLVQNAWQTVQSHDSNYVASILKAELEC